MKAIVRLMWTEQATALFMGFFLVVGLGACHSESDTSSNTSKIGDLEGTPFIVENQAAQHPPNWSSDGDEACDKVCKAIFCDTPEPAQLSSPLASDKTSLLYEPWKNNQVMSYAFKRHSGDRAVYLVKSVGLSILDWQETCLAENIVDYDNFVDCFKSDKTQLTLKFSDHGNEFQLKHNKQCLSMATNLMWVPCDVSDLKQYFTLDDSIKFGLEIDLLFKLKNVASGSYAFDGKYVHFRDAFPLIAIRPPILSLPSKGDVNSFIQNSNFSALKRNDIILLGIDTMRLDALSSDVTPNLYEFSKNSISFRKSFAGATATRGSVFTLWNSRPAYEQMYFKRNKYLEDGHIHLRILNRLGYKVQSFAYNTSVIDENLFNDAGWYGGKYRDLEVDNTTFKQNFENRVFIGRNVFDYLDPHRKNDDLFKYSMTKGDYDSTIPMIVSERAADLLIGEIEKPSDRPRSFLLWMVGPHEPAISNNQEEGIVFNKREPTISFDITTIFDPTLILLSWKYFFESIENEKLAIVNAYLNAASNTDYIFGNIIKKLKELGKYDDAMIVALSDHGQLLGEHGKFFHGGSPVQKSIEMPILYKFPHGERSQSDVKTQYGMQMDVFPSIYDYLGVRAHEKSEGHGFEHLFKGRSVFKGGHVCQISGTPFGNINATVEIAFFNGKEKLRARLEIKETNRQTSDESALSSNHLEVLAYTDYWDRPLDSGHSMVEVEALIHEKFDKCFAEYF